MLCAVAILRAVVVCVLEKGAVLLSVNIPKYKLRRGVDGSHGYPLCVVCWGYAAGEVEVALWYT